MLWRRAVLRVVVTYGTGRMYHAHRDPHVWQTDQKFLCAFSKTLKLEQSDDSLFHSARTARTILFSVSR